MSASGIRQQQILLIVATLAIGLAADVHTGFGGQYAISAGFWGVLFYLFGRVDRDERRAVMACLPPRARYSVHSFGVCTPIAWATSRCSCRQGTR